MEQENKAIDETSRLETDEDFINKLPDEVVEKILSVHPLDSGSKAVALFTGIWNRPCIKHGGTAVNYQEFESVVTKFLLDFDEKNPLQFPRRLEYHFNQGLILTATIGLNKKLNLDFSKGNQDFSGKQFQWEIWLNSKDTSYPIWVNTLKLTSVDFMTYEFVSSLIKKFKLVENLIIEKATGSTFVRICSCYNVPMKISIQDCVGLNLVIVNHRQLKSLRYSGPYCWLWLFLNSGVDLQELMLDFKSRPNNYWYSKTVRIWMLRVFSHTKVVTIHGWMYKDVIDPWLNSEKKVFTLSKLEDLWWIDSCLEDDNLDWLFSFLKFCTCLKRLFIKIDPLRSNTRRRPILESSTKIKNGRRTTMEDFMEGYRTAIDRIVGVTEGIRSSRWTEIPKHVWSVKESNQLSQFVLQIFERS